MTLDPSEIFKALAVETRLKIIELLKTHGPLGSKIMSSELGITASAVSQHLKVLRHVGLVKRRRCGYFMPYALDEQTLEDSREAIDRVCRCGCGHRRASADPDLRTLNVESLRQYKRELRNEILRVEKKIKEIERNNRS